MVSEITTSNYKDRSTGLILFGVLEILMGVVAGFMGIGVVLVGLFIKLPNTPPTPWFASIFYFVMAVGLIWLGVGSVQAKRWARALLLVLSWIWLVVGVTADVTMMAIMPAMLESISQTAQNTGEAHFAKLFAMVFMGIILFVIYFLIPGVLVLFYRSPHVRMTCEVKDPQERWTDHCPLPVLALCVCYFFGFLVLAIFMPAYGFIFPLFGNLVSGFPGALATGVFLVALAYMVWGFYKVQVSAWWTAVVVTLVGYGSALVTFSQVSLLELYQKMNFSAEQLEAIQKTGLLQSNFMVIQLAIGIVLMTGYLLFVKRYFKAK